MKKTERAKLLDKVYDRSHDGWSGDAYAVSPETVVKMLLAERAQVRRVVRKVKSHAEVSVYGAGYQKACDDILTKLKEGR